MGNTLPRVLYDTDMILVASHPITLSLSANIFVIRDELTMSEQRVRSGMTHVLTC